MDEILRASNATSIPHLLIVPRTLDLLQSIPTPVIAEPASASTEGLPVNNIESNDRIIGLAADVLRNAGRALMYLLRKS